MAVRANLVVGAIGAILALGSGSIIAVNWESLVGLETWEARFETHDARLPERGGTLAAGAKRTEVHDIPVANVTRINVDLTWRDPAFNAPEITVRLLDPSRVVRAEDSHTGGATGIHLEVDVMAPEDVPQGPATFRVRNDPQDLNAHNAFATRWPTQDASRGNWTIEIIASAPEGPAPGSSIVYTLRTDYQFYTGTFAKVPETLR